MTKRRHPLVTLALGVDWFATFAWKNWVSLRDRIFWRFTSPDERDLWSARRYSNQNEYLPDGAFFNQGLFDWEEKIMSSPLFPKHGHILVGGCGAGREVAALLKRGYAVTAFDPSSDFIHAAQIYFEKDARVKLFQASYRDVILTSLPHLNAHFDAILLGWLSLAHITETNDREALLQKLRALAPSAVVGMSFYAVGEEYSKNPNVYWSHAGFIRICKKSEIEILAKETGYEMTEGYFLSYPQAYALFRPLV